jgi:hypothetical protein
MYDYTPKTLNMSEDEMEVAEVLTNLVDSTIRMNKLSGFVSRQLINHKPNQYERYCQAKSCKDILYLISKGNSKGTECEKFARECFTSLGPRLKGDTKKSGYDQIHIPSGKRAEQKTAGNWELEDHSWKWQHIEPKHNWKFLLFCGIAYHDIHWFFLSRDKFHELCDKKIIEKQGDENNSYQGWWVGYKNIKNHLIEIKSNEHLDELVSGLPK